MKQQEQRWEPVEPFEAPRPEPRPPFQELPPEENEDSPQFAAIRRIELLSRLHHMAFRSLFQPEGLPPAQAGAMKVIIHFPGMSQRELADKLHIQRATATVMLQKMERSGYIDRRPDPGDQRISRIYPTDYAKAVDAENLKKVSAYFERCFAGMSQKQFDQMLEGLTVLGNNLRDILDENSQSLKE